MPLEIRTTIRNMSDVSANDGLEEDYDYLVQAEADGTVCTVDCEAAYGYFDITFPDGREIQALSWHHLDGFGSLGDDAFGPKL